MKITLRRNEYRPDGIFGTLYFTESYTHICLTLERGYADLNEPFGLRSKIPPGVYTCERGIHKLGEELKEIETFEVMDVPDCWGILFHPGNFQTDVDGCIAPGDGYGRGPRGEQIVTHSKKAFKHLMNILKELDEFTLTVEA